MNNLLDKYDSSRPQARSATRSLEDMTAQQVREFDWAKHEKELDHLVAVKVMGWMYVEDTGECGCGMECCRQRYYRKPKENQVIMRHDWHPSTDMNDAMTVAEKFNWFRLLKCPLGYDVWMFQKCPPGQDKSPARAICIAALIAKKK